MNLILLKYLRHASPLRAYNKLDISMKKGRKHAANWRQVICWEGLGAGEEGDDGGWDGWMASLTRWTRVWVNSGSWWWTGRPGVLRFMGSQGRTPLSKWTELNWTERNISWKDGHNKGQKRYGPNRSRRYKEEVARIHKNCTKKIFTTQIITMVWSLT